MKHLPNCRALTGHSCTCWARQVDDLAKKKEGVTMAGKKVKGMKLKTCACWICSKKLWGNKFQLCFIDGYKRKVHILCAKKYDRNIED